MSRCTRCLADIKPADLIAFLKAQHLCPDCAGTTDSQFAERIKASEKGKTVPE